MTTKVKLDPDFRRDPKTSMFCCRCQQDIADASKAVRVSVDWDAWDVWPDANGEHLLGRDCAKAIGLAAILEVKGGSTQPPAPQSGSEEKENL